MLDLFDVVPERYHAALWLGAGQGCRIGEVLDMEDSAHCFDVDHRELHVVQQLQYDTAAYGGFYLKEPKAARPAPSSWMTSSPRSSASTCAPTRRQRSIWWT